MSILSEKLVLEWKKELKMKVIEKISEKAKMASIIN